MTRHGVQGSLNRLPVETHRCVPRCRRIGISLCMCNGLFVLNDAEQNFRQRLAPRTDAFPVGDPGLPSDRGLWIAHQRDVIEIRVQMPPARGNPFKRWCLKYQAMQPGKTVDIIGRGVRERFGIFLDCMRACALSAFTQR